MDKLNQQVTPTGNSGLAKVAVSFTEVTFVVNKTFVPHINICDKNLHLYKAENR